jgi:phage terminase small subunit
MKLSDKHIQFVEDYLISGNATDSWLKIYPNAKRSSASSNACETLALPKIKDYIQLRRNELANKCLITKEEILADLKYIKDLHRDNPRSSNSIKAICEINKMLGFYMPTESTINMNIEQPLFGSDE